jgi:hypothetical protein
MTFCKPKKIAAPVFLLVTLLQQSLIVAAMAQPGSVTLAWDASRSGEVAGYRLYSGTASHNYSNVMDVSTNTVGTISGLTTGYSYFFAVTAYSSVGVESPYSGEISYTLPTAAHLQMAMSSSHQAFLSGTAPAGYEFQVQATQDLQNWSSIGSITANPEGSFGFTDPLPANGSERFYRLKQTAP